MDHLVHQSLDYLRTMYPDDWSVCSKGTPMWRLGQHSIGVVNLARLTGAHHLLPCALMQCCSLGSSVVDGFAREDGTREYLSTQDLGLCFNAKDKLIEARVQIARTIFEAMDEECDDDASCECEGDILYVLPALEAGILPGLCTPKPLASWGSFIKANMPRLCPQCRQTLSNRATAARRATFERLPTLMGVGPLENWGKKKVTKAA